MALVEIDMEKAAQIFCDRLQPVLEAFENRLMSALDKSIAAAQDTARTAAQEAVKEAKVFLAGHEFKASFVQKIGPQPPQA